MKGVKTMEAKITEPKAGAYTRHELPVRGVYSNPHEGIDLWMVTIPETLQNYHPQSTSAVLEDGGWSAMAYIGNSRPDADIGVRFTLLLVSATRKASDVFRNYIAEAARRQQWLGLGQLPKGAEIVHQVEVIRNDKKADPVPTAGSSAKESDRITIRDIRASDNAMVILGQRGDIHIHRADDSVDVKETTSKKAVAAAAKKRLVVDLQKRQVYYHGVKVDSLPPRDLICLGVLAQHPGVALSVKTIYKMAVQQEIDAERFNAEANNLPKPKVIRFAIRKAILQSLEAQADFKFDDSLKNEVHNLLDSSRDGTITLQIPVEEVRVVASPGQSIKMGD